MLRLRAGGWGRAPLMAQLRVAAAAMHLCDRLFGQLVRYCPSPCESICRQSLIPSMPCYRAPTETEKRSKAKLQSLLTEMQPSTKTD